MDIVKSIDGNEYICTTCKLSIEKNKEPVRGQKEFLAFLDYPEDFKKEVEDVCQPAAENKSRADLNRLEDFILKLVIPYIRIGHLPRGPYVKVKGDLIMITSDLPHSLNKILPQTQDLLGVAFKRNLKYSGHFIEETIDRSKVHVYFKFFQKYNHLYKEYSFSDETLQEFQRAALEAVNREDKDDSESSDSEDDEEMHEHPGKAKIATTSLVMDKYKEDSSKQTVANRVADMVVQFEAFYQDEPQSEDVVEPDDELFPEDEEVTGQIQEEDDIEDSLMAVELSDSDHDKLKNLKLLKQEVLRFSSVIPEDHCRCCTFRICSELAYSLQKLQDLNPESDELKMLIQKFITKTDEMVQHFRSVVKTKLACKHVYNDLTDLLQNFVYDKNNKPENIRKHVHGLRQQIDTNLNRFSIAPGQEGKFKNWGSDLYLEEKLFPNLFPYGIGGFLSSNLIKKSNMGFSNYVKTRLLSVNPKFRKDPFYIFFLLLVKEMVEMKRSEKTFYRKATKVKNLTVQTIKETDKEFLLRNNAAFTAFKTQRGTAMYYQAVKKNLMAMIRQKGPPTLFCTFSAAEFNWEELAQKICETKIKKKVSIEVIREQTSAWKNKLISENVVQSTLHFAKRTDKLMALLSSVPIFEHEGIHYKVGSYFYRVEFQARGAPHIHAMFWVDGENGENPPTMYATAQDGSVKLEDNAASISEFANSIMCGSSNDISCSDHKEIDVACDKCQNLKRLVDNYQTHSHRQSCLKKKKILRISPLEGHGHLDGKKESDELIVCICRYNFPKNPMDKAEFLYAFPENVDKNELKQAKDDYLKIRKYLLRLTYGENFKNQEQWLNFVNLSFYEFLQEVGMFKPNEDSQNEEARHNARQRYLTALRCEVKSSGLTFLRRDTRDIFTNNFNKKLIKIHQANQDIQYIHDNGYAVAEYVSDYCTKLESGQTALLKKINEEALESGEATKKTLQKLCEQLDTGI